MVEDEDKKSTEVLKAGKKTDEESKPEGADKDKDAPKKESDQKAHDQGWDRDRGGYPPDNQGYPPQQPYYPPPQPLFTSSNLQKVLAIGILICIILLFVGAMLGAGSRFVEPKDEGDLDLKRNLSASGILLGAIGLFILGLFLAISLMQIRDLSDKQKLLIVILGMGVLISFAFLTNSLFVL